MSKKSSTLSVLMVFFLPILIYLVLFISVGFGVVEFDSYKLSDWFSYVVGQFNSWNFKVPDIPTLPTDSSSGGGFFGEVLKVLTDFVNFFVRILNVVIMVLNLLLSCIQFVFTMFTSIGKLYELLNPSVVTDTILNCI